MGLEAWGLSMEHKQVSKRSSGNRRTASVLEGGGRKDVRIVRLSGSNLFCLIYPACRLSVVVVECSGIMSFNEFINYTATCNRRWSCQKWRADWSLALKMPRLIETEHRID